MLYVGLSDNSQEYFAYAGGVTPEMDLKKNEAAATVRIKSARSPLFRRDLPGADEVTSLVASCC